jgi:hypothetical protein
MKRLTLPALLAVAMAAAGCQAADYPDAPLAPKGVTPGRRLPWPEEAKPVTDWSFASGEQEIAIETRGTKGRSSVTVWCVVVDRKLYVATDSRSRKRWVAQIEASPSARVGIAGRTYPVRARRVQKPDEWDAVMAAYGRKYAGQIARYDFPKAGDTSSGRVFELLSAPAGSPQP